LALGILADMKFWTDVSEKGGEMLARACGSLTHEFYEFLGEAEKFLAIFDLLKMCQGSILNKGETKVKCKGREWLRGYSRVYLRKWRGDCFSTASTLPDFFTSEYQCTNLRHHEKKRPKSPVPEQGARDADSAG
jgi:hypothetical protein